MLNSKMVVVLAGALCIGLTSCSSAATQARKDMQSSPSSEKTPTVMSNQGCADDTAAPSLAPEWKLLWQKTFEQPIARPPVVNGAQLIVIERGDVPSDTSQYRDTLWALNPQTSDVQWKVGDPQAPRQVMQFMLSPKYVASIVRKYNSSAEPSLPPISESTIIIDRSSGRVIRDLEVGVEALSDEALYHRSLFTDQSNLYAVGFDGNVYQYDAADGRLLATDALGTMPAVHDFVVQGNLVVVRSGHGFEGITAFDLNTMTTRWATPVSYPSLRRSIAFWDAQVTFTVTPEAAYVYDAQNTLLRIDLRTGQVVWRVPAIEAEPMSPPVAVGGLVYGLFADGTVRAFSETDGSSVGTVMKVPIWYWYWTDDAQDWRDRVGGLTTADNTLIIATGCRSVFAIQHNK